MEDVAAVVGVTRQAVALWENGAREPRGENLERYLEVLEALKREMSAIELGAVVESDKLAAAGAAGGGVAAGSGPDSLAASGRGSARSAGRSGESGTGDEGAAD
jgi:transcriptional regulator with XRE-family HTH domain